MPEIQPEDTDEATGGIRVVLRIDWRHDYYKEPLATSTLTMPEKSLSKRTLEPAVTSTHLLIPSGEGKFLYCLSSL